MITINNTILFAGLALIVSNAPLIPSIIFSFFKRKYTLTCIYTVLYVASSLYHLCQADFYCITTFHNHQIIDHFFVYTAFTWTIFFLIRLNAELTISLITLIQFVLLLTIMKWIDSWILAGVTIGSILLITLILVFIYGIPKGGTRDFIGALVLIIVGIVLHVLAGDPGDRNYPFYHSMWHILAFVAIYYVIETSDNESLFHKLFCRKKYVKY